MAHVSCSQLQREYPALRTFQQPANAGKGAALRVGIQAATGDIIIIQDADLEYDPADYPHLIAADRRGQGRRRLRFALSGAVFAPRAVLLALLGNKFLTTLSNCFTDSEPDRHGDLLQGVPREVHQAIPDAEEDRFGFEPEITAKIARRRFRSTRSISYSGRTYEEGKKIGWKDGLRALWCLLKYSVKEPRLAVQPVNPGEASAPARRHGQECRSLDFILSQC